MVHSRKKGEPEFGSKHIDEGWKDAVDKPIQIRGKMDKDIEKVKKSVM